MRPWSDMHDIPRKPAVLAMVLGASLGSGQACAQSSPATTEPVPTSLNQQAEADNSVPDPWEHYNRRVYRFNKQVDRRIAKPVALAYQRDVPKPIRTGVTHFFNNLHQPVNAANLLLQGHPGKSAESLGRFAVDTTVGIGGLFDPATGMHIPQFNEDFGQTLGRWGWRHSRYLLIPFFGPGTLRDRVGRLVDGQLSWYHFVPSGPTRLGLLGLSLVDKRVQLLPLDKLVQGMAGDDYALVRDAWGQRRNHQIDDQTIRSAGADAATDEQELQTYGLPQD